MKRQRAVWQVQDAKNRFSEVLEEAHRHGPQIVTRRGKETAVILSVERYRELTGEKTPSLSFTEFLLAAPKSPGGLRVERSRDKGRRVELG